jgi:hypothetical protein
MLIAVRARIVRGTRKNITTTTGSNLLDDRATDHALEGIVEALMRCR